MKVVIDISEKVYGVLKYFESAFDGFEPNDIKGTLIMSVLQGKILPKGHGRLIDADALEVSEYATVIGSQYINESRPDESIYEYMPYYKCSTIKNAPTIIEEDK